jgi:hypothetical protein
LNFYPSIFYTVFWQPFWKWQTSQTKFGRLSVFAPFLIIILFLLSFRGPWTCPRQISGTTGQNFMKLGGVIDICF